MKRRYELLFGVLLLAGCERAPMFTVEGELWRSACGTDSVYLVYTGLTETYAVDSCAVQEDGTFLLHGSAPSTPELYRLVAGDGYKVLAVDSTETIVLRGDSITGSPVSQRIESLRQSIRTRSPEEHKAFAIETIMEMPGTLAAYYAVFQSKNGVPVFDIHIPQDRRFYQAVATSMQVHMPESERTKILSDQVIGVMNAERSAANAAIMREFIEASENYLPEISLPNIYGDTCRLSELRGKVILLDFSAIEMEQSPAYMLSLRELYRKYSPRGFEIYSVSVDRSRLYWEDGVRALPWTCVRTELRGPLLDYNVTTIPTEFIIDQNGVVRGRYNGDFEAISRDLQQWF